ncbi:vesicle transport through interaction with t-SNAREs homolog 1A isoform X7 [Falco peregrinus]|uniref:vesicle transport through interaction with t-SNAREs homolog 1A isoform X7 n=1 Tax=Falco peregrinus TaxID=8954 RepID=UPI0024799738|nr:vesicle transport through interaction with t-SNAREs homolog 1A isoform X7 [Falco peregrinus]
MSSDFESYEQDFAVLTAEITGRIGKVPKLVGDEKKQMVVNVEKQLEEARDLLEQMELEVREIPPQSRGMYSSRMRSYKQEMGKLEADFQYVPVPHFGSRAAFPRAVTVPGAGVMAPSGGPKRSCRPQTCAFRVRKGIGTTYQRVPDISNNPPMSRWFSCTYQCTVLWFKPVNIFFSTLSAVEWPWCLPV